MPADALPGNISLELRNVSKHFGDLPALTNIYLRVERGESFLLYGPNGAGKTTLLRTLASLSRPSEGEVLFCGEDVHRDPARAKARIGFASHTTFLYAELSARENLRFAGTLFGLKRLEERIDAALDLFSVRDRAADPVRTLSRGLQQRVTLARAMLHDPDFLLLDEPFTGLDAAAVKALQKLLARVTDQNKGIIVSTHDFAQGAAVAKRLVVMERGRIRYDGPLCGAAFVSLGLS